jgi:hypothetical protein
LDAAKSKLESVAKEFEVKQEKLHDDYEKKKQVLIAHARSLEKKVRGLETDGSMEDRQVACKKLVKSIKTLLQRKSLSLQ